MFHRLEPRIRAHVLLCWLALLLTRVAERRSGMTWRRIATELGHIHAVTLQGSAGTVVQTTPPSEESAARRTSARWTRWSSAGGDGRRSRQKAVVVDEHPTRRSGAYLQGDLFR